MNPVYHEGNNFGFEEETKKKRIQAEIPIEWYDWIDCHCGHVLGIEIADFIRMAIVRKVIDECLTRGLPSPDFVYDEFHKMLRGDK